MTTLADLQAAAAELRDLVATLCNHLYTHPAPVPDNAPADNAYDTLQHAGNLVRDIHSMLTSSPAPEPISLEDAEPPSPLPAPESQPQ